MACTCVAGAVAAATSDVRCVGVKGHSLLLASRGRTSTFRLAGVVMPGTTPAEQSLFANLCYVHEFVVRDLQTNVARVLNAYTNQPLKITDTVGSDIWLESADGQSVNCTLVSNGVALVGAKPPSKYRKVLVAAQEAALKAQAGVWSLPPRSEVTTGLRFKCAARTDINNDAKDKGNYSPFRTTDKLISHTRVIELVIIAPTLKRAVVLDIKYQFKLGTFAPGSDKPDGRTLTTSPAKAMEVVVLPGETKTVTCKSEEIIIMQHIGADDTQASYKKGTSFEDEMISVTYGDRELFAQGKIVNEASDESEAPSEPTKDTGLTRRSY